MFRCPARRVGVLLHLLAAVTLAATVAAQDNRAIKALDQWMTQYLAGRLDLARNRINKTAPGVRAGIVPEERAQRIGHLEELDAICRAAAGLDGPDKVERLLVVAAVGLDGSGKGDVEMRPHAVRRIGERWLDRLDTAEDSQVVEEFAANERATKGLAMARRAAAIRALGRRHDEIYRPFVEQGLLAGEEEIRLAAAEAAGTAELLTLLPPLIAALSREKTELVLTAGLDAMFKIIAQHREAVAQDVLRRVADVAVMVLGRGSWRSDLAAVELLARVRSAQSVPALIGVLDRFSAGAAPKEDLASGLLKERTQEVLVSLTAARFPAERADQWHAWWESVKGEFQVAELKEDDGRTDEGRTVTSDFFGIPVRGSRVLFVVDCSGSMAERWRGRGDRTGTRDELKIDVARRELANAVARLTVDCQFNVVWFGNGAEVWQRDMVPADEKHKKKFEKLVEELRADGGTNLWQGLRDGLKLESFVYGDRYGATYDQMFVLSDGLPTIGEVQDPKEILLLVRETNRYSRLRIDTIYIAGDPDMERRAAREVGMGGAEFMRSLAEQNGGISIAF